MPGLCPGETHGVVQNGVSINWLQDQDRTDLFESRVRSHLSLIQHVFREGISLLG